VAIEMLRIPVLIVQPLDIDRSSELTSTCFLFLGLYHQCNMVRPDLPDHLPEI